MVLKIKENYSNSLVEQKQKTIDDMAAKLDEYDRKKDDALDKARLDAKLKSESQANVLRIVYTIIALIVLLGGLLAYSITSFPWDNNAFWEVIIIVLSLIGLYDILKSREGIIKRHIARFQASRYAMLYEQKLDEVNKYYS